MNIEQRSSKTHSERLHLVWINSESMEKLDAATWLNTTKELREMGWNVTLIAPGQYGKRALRNISFFAIPRPNIYLLRQAIFHLRVILYIRKLPDPIDVLLFHSMSAPWLMPLKIWRSLLKKDRPHFVMDTRTLHMAPEDKETKKDKVRAFYHMLMNKITNRWADGRTAITKHIAKSLKIPNNKLWGVWPSGVQLEQFEQAQEKRTWPQQNEPIHLIYIGCMHYERNLMNLSKAIVRANSKEHKFTFTMVGDGNERHDLETYAKNSAKHIQIVPTVPHEQIPNWLSRAHVGALPFPDEEKFRVSSPIKLFEYMASGLPVFATRIACHTDVVGSHNYAFWATDSKTDGLYEALEALHKKKDTLAQMGHIAASNANQWTWKASAEKLDAALKQGLERAKDEK